MLAKVGQNEEKVRFFSSERASEKNLTFGRNFWSRLTVEVEVLRTIPSSQKFPPKTKKSLDITANPIRNNCCTEALMDRLVGLVQNRQETHLAAKPSVVRSQRPFA